MNRKKTEVLFQVSDDFNNETTKTITKLLAKCRYKKFIEKVTIKKLSRNGLYFKINWVRGRKPLLLSDELTLGTSNSQEWLLVAVKQICE